MLQGFTAPYQLWLKTECLCEAQGNIPQHTYANLSIALDKPSLDFGKSINQNDTDYTTPYTPDNGKTWQIDQSVMSGLIGADNRFGRDFGHPDADMQGNIVGLYDIGCVIGSLFVLFVGERTGRRTMIMLGGTTMIIGTIILASSYSIAQLIVGLIVTGFGNGMNSSTIPVYQSEASPASMRGVFLTFNGTITIFGLVIAYWLDYGTSFYETEIQWRFPLAFQALFALCLVLQVTGLPESPRWLVQHDRLHDAQNVVSALRDLPPDHFEVKTALLDIQTAVEQESRGGPFRWSEIFGWGKIQNFRRILLSIGIEIMQQFTGSNMM
ncbi:MAG: hypothetical protein Q9159_005503 [Coniocarpon cinnabarinum]